MVESWHKATMAATNADENLPDRKDRPHLTRQETMASTDMKYKRMRFVDRITSVSFDFCFGWLTPDQLTPSRAIGRDCFPSNRYSFRTEHSITPEQAKFYFQNGYYSPLNKTIDRNRLAQQ